MATSYSLNVRCVQVQDAADGVIEAGFVYQDGGAYVVGGTPAFTLSLAASARELVSDGSVLELTLSAEA